jgi:hypothetical protein
MHAGNERKNRWRASPVQSVMGARFHFCLSKESPMPRSRQRLADFEARSVQLIAACTLGLAGVAAVHGTPSARVTGQAGTATSQSSGSDVPNAHRGTSALRNSGRKLAG